MNVAGLFAGIGGIELGLAASGFHASLLCEFDRAALAVLRARFPGTRLTEDIRELDKLPREIDLVTAGFPCQDLSQAGQTKGIVGERSGLVAEVFRLLRHGDIPEVLIENVPFMLQLDRGQAMRVLTRNLEDLGYRWAYRVLDALAFGVPQRRHRVFLFASKRRDPGSVLFRSDAAERIPREREGRACGFFWTEGERGLGWAVDAVPTLKGGSTIGVPSPPAIWFPDGRIETPDIRDAERLQGFPAEWTSATETVARATFRWKQVGNAVAVPVIDWIGQGLVRPSAAVCRTTGPIDVDRRWPRAGMLVDGQPMQVEASLWPIERDRPPLADFLRYPTRPLSARATVGFLSRLHKGHLRLAEGFLDAVESHAVRMGAQLPNRPAPLLTRSLRPLTSQARASEVRPPKAIRARGVKVVASLFEP